MSSDLSSPLSSDLISDDQDTSLYAYNKDFLVQYTDFSLMFNDYTILGGEHQQIIKDQYKWLELKSKNLYKEIRKNYYKEIIETNQVVEQNEYYSNLLKYYIKTYIFNIQNNPDNQNNSDTLFESIETKTNISDKIGFDLFILCSEIFDKYFDNKFKDFKIDSQSELRPKINSSTNQPIVLIDNTKSSDLDKFVTISSEFYKKRNDFNKSYKLLSNNIAEIKNLENYSLDFKNNQYIIENKILSIKSSGKTLDLSTLTLRDNADTLTFITKNIPFELYKLNRLLLLNNKLNPDEFIQNFLVPPTRKDLTNNASFTDKFNILLSSMKNRIDIIEKGVTYKAYNRYLSKAFLVYYYQLLQSLYKYLKDHIDNINKPDIVGSLSISIILYKSLFKFFKNNMKDTEAIDLEIIKKWFPNEINLFQLFFIELKPILDQYKICHNFTKIRVFCKINDNPNQKKKIESNNTKKKLTNLSLNNENTIFHIKKEITQKDEEKKEENKNYLYIKKRDNPDYKINFTKVFNTDIDNAILTSYIGLGNSLENLEGTIFYTFGASGTGKSYTLFGDSENTGILKTAIASITNIKNVYIKVFEIYGLGFNDINYWQETKQHHIFEKYIVHNIEFNEGKFQYKQKNNNDHIEIYNFDEFKEYTNDLETSYTKIPGAVSFSALKLEEFNNIIEKKRQFGYNIPNTEYKIKTIKPTANNPVSSRSIMVYEFIIEKEIIIQNGPNTPLQSKTINIPLILIDMPGKEIIKSSYGCVASPATCRHIVTNPKETDKITTDKNTKTLYNKTFCNKCELKHYLYTYRNIQILVNKAKFIIQYERDKGLSQYTNLLKDKSDSIVTYLRNSRLNIEEFQISDKIKRTVDEINTILLDTIDYNTFPELKQIIDIETDVCNNEPKIFGILPGELCLNLPKYFKLLDNQLNNDLAKIWDLVPFITYYKTPNIEIKTGVFSQTRVKTCNFTNQEIIETFKTIFTNLRNTYNEAFTTNNFMQLSKELYELTKDYYRLPLSLKYSKDSITYTLEDFYNEIFEGIYINENINGIMFYMINYANNKLQENQSQESSISSQHQVTSSSDIIQEMKTDKYDKTNIYDETNIFNKNKINIQKLFDYYNSNTDRAKIENFVSLFVCSNISQNAILDMALNKNVKTNQTELFKSNYYNTIKAQQIDMFDSFQPILEELIK